MPTISPRVSTVDGTPVLGRIRSVTFGAGQAPTVQFQLLDDLGNPVDITAYVSPPPDPAPATPVVQLKAVEAAGRGNGGLGIAAFAGSVVDQAVGIVSARVLPAQLSQAGVYEASFGVHDPDGYPAVVNTFLMVLEPNLFGPTATCGPPRLDEVRTLLRASDPAESRLLSGTTVFDDAEVASAIVTAVQAWNSSQPPVAPLTTCNFPRDLHFQLIQGASAQLLYMAAEWYRRNYLVVQGAGGVSVADMDKADTCDKAADRRWQQYLDWVRRQKMAINASRAFGRLGSAYRLIAWSSINP